MLEVYSPVGVMESLASPGEQKGNNVFICKKVMPFRNSWGAHMVPVVLER